MDNMRPAEVEAVIRFARAGLSALSERSLTWAGLFLSAALFAYAAWEATWIQAAAACAFAVLVYWPLVRLETKKRSEQ